MSIIRTSINVFDFRYKIKFIETYIRRFKQGVQMNTFRISDEM